MKKLFTISLFLLANICLWANTYIDTAEDNWTYGNMHQWHAHSAYSQINTVAVTKDKVYGLSNHSLFSVDKQSEELSYYSRMTGLNGAVISTIGYNPTLDLLLICYENGQLDIINAEGQIDNIPDLYIKQSSFSKIANSIHMHGTTAYLAMDFGIIVLDMKKREVKDTYIIGINASEVSVKHIAIMGDSIYAVSPYQLFAAALHDPLSDYAYWHPQALPSGKEVVDLCAHDAQLYLIRDTELWSRNAGKWHKIATPYAVQGLCPVGDELYILPTDQAGYALSSNLSLQEPMLGVITDVQADGKDRWVASLSHGLIRYSDQQHFIPDGPINNIAYRMRFFGDRLYIVPGGRWATQNNTPGDIMYYENGSWTNISNAQLNEATGTTILDLMNVAQDPKDPNHYFVTSYGLGLLEMHDTTVVKLHNHTNSQLKSAAPNNPLRAGFYVRTDGAMFDEQGYLWVINTEVDKNLHIMDANGNTLAAYNLESNSGRIQLYTPGEIMVDKRNTQWKWIPICRANNGIAAGLLLLQDNGTPLNPMDDKVIYKSEWYDQNGKPVAPESIYCMTQDHDNTIWVGTNAGLFLIPATVDFASSNQCQRIIIGRNDGTGLGDYLLENEQINHIVVDGANRKWIATATSGVFLLSPNGEETIEHFTANNSPLPSDNVLSIAIQQSTGEVFFGTSQGLVSYMSDAVEPEENFEELYAYPNPVYPNYKGVVVIKGLMNNSLVRIVDANGNLVANIQGNGGEAIWDLTNAQGTRVASGIYTALCNTQDGAAHSTVKIMVMN